MLDFVSLHYNQNQPESGYTIEDILNMIMEERV